MWPSTWKISSDYMFLDIVMLYMESLVLLNCWAWKTGKCTEDFALFYKNHQTKKTRWCYLLSLVNLKHRKSCFNNGLPKRYVLPFKRISILLNLQRKVCSKSYSAKSWYKSSHSLVGTFRDRALNWKRIENGTLRAISLGLNSSLAETFVKQV